MLYKVEDQRVRNRDKTVNGVVKYFFLICIQFTAYSDCETTILSDAPLYISYILLFLSEINDR